MLNLFRSDGWVKTSLGPAVPGAQIWLCFQPANVASAPPSPLVPMFSDPAGNVPITQPILTDGFGHYDFYTVAGVYTLVVAYGGLIQQVYPDQSIGGVGNGSGGGTALSLQVNGSPNGSQTQLNLTGAGSVAVSDNGSGTVTITGTVFTGPAFQTNGVTNVVQNKLNLVNGANIAITSDGAGNTTITSTSFGGFSTPGLGWFLGGDSWGPVSDVPGTPGSTAPIANQIVAVQLIVLVPFTISKLSAYVATGGGAGYMCAGLYTSNGNTKIIDAGVNAFDTHSASQAERNVTLGVSVVVSPGVYWFAFGSTDGNASVVLHQPFTYFPVMFSGSVTRVGVCANHIVAGAMPTTLGTITPLAYSGSGQPNVPAIMFQV